MARRRCLGFAECGRYIERGSWCTKHERERKAIRNEDAGRAAAVVAEHRARFGDWCPGWGRDPHQSSDLTADHVTPISRARAAGGRLKVLCRSCNARRSNRRA